MSEVPRFPTSLGTSDAHHIRLMGHEVADLMGEVTFGELAYWLVAGRRPTPGQRRVFEAVLVALADHGFTPTAIAARLTYLRAPESVQGAVAAGLLGGGSRFLGVTEDCALFLHEALAPRSYPTDDAGFDALAREAVTARRGGRRRLVPGLGHPVHKERRPAHPGAVPDRRGGGAQGAAPAAVRGRRPGALRTCSAGRCRSTAPACAVPRSPTSTCRCESSAGSRCSPAPRGSSATSPRRCAAPSAWTST